MSRTIVVTGASSGIGAATVRVLAKDGHHVIAAARRTDRLDALSAETGATPLRLDITDQNSVDEFASRIESCDALINNAGAAFGPDPIESANIDDWKAMYELNVIGTARVTQALLPALRRSENGDIVMVTSTAGHLAYEGGGGYVASKYAMRTIAETLRLELCGEPMRVIEIAPGVVKTDEFSLNRFAGDERRVDALYDDVDGPLLAQDIAECIRWTISLPPHVNVDSMIVRPRVQATQYRTHRGPVQKASEKTSE